MTSSCVVEYQEHTAVNASPGNPHPRAKMGYQGRSPWLVRPCWPSDWGRRSQEELVTAKGLSTRRIRVSCLKSKARLRRRNQREQTYVLLIQQRKRPATLIQQHWPVFA